MTSHLSCGPARLAISAFIVLAFPLLVHGQMTMAELAKLNAPGVSVHEVSDYAFGNYAGSFTSPPQADGNPRKAFIVTWHDRRYRFVFAHEGSYCPWFELSDGSGVCFQFFEGNDGWAELFNQYGRMEKNSFVELLDRGPRRVHVRWTYYGVNQNTGERAYRAIEDFYCLSSGLVLRRQSYETFLPGQHHGYAREPIEMIGMCPVGKLWKDVLRKNEKTGEHHALAALDPYSTKRYDVFWKAKPDTVWEATPRREGCTWKEIDDADGVVLVVPMRAGSVFCAFGRASGFDPNGTRLKEHSYADTGGNDWVSSSWDHWPIGWLNSQGHVVDAASLKKYPNHFSPAGMDFFAMPNQVVEKGVYWSLCGVIPRDVEGARVMARQWLDLGATRIGDPAAVEKLPVLPSTKPSS
jgi:hypothetical protein